jgi:hypothetical protein
MKALACLKAHNPHYEDISIDPEALSELETDQNPIPAVVRNAMRWFSVPDEDKSPSDHHPGFVSSEPTPATEEIAPKPFLYRSGCCNVNAPDATPDAIQAAAVRVLLGKKLDDDVLCVPHGTKPSSTYEAAFWPQAFPDLFCLGTGCPVNPNRPVRMGLKSWAKRSMSLWDRRFERHFNFCFALFDHIQTKTVCRKARVMVEKPKKKKDVDLISTLTVLRLIKRMHLQRHIPALEHR